MQLQKPEMQLPPAHEQTPSRPHVLLHVNIVPQLSATCDPPQRSPHGLPVDVQPHPFGPAPPPPHVFGATHVLGHATTCPQLFVAMPQALAAHVVASGSGVQQFVPTHT